MENQHRMLAVDDAPEMLELVRMIFRRKGFDVTTARHAAPALSLCRELQPDIILLDINMPDVDGFELCRQMRQDTDAPIIFLTARDAAEDVELGFAVGGNDFVAKPFSCVDLVKRVKAILERSASGEEAHGAAREAVPAAPGGLLRLARQRQVPALTKAPG